MEKLSRTSTVLNRTSVKRYALAVSSARRAGKFTRVGVPFIERCEARLEAAIRGLSAENSVLTPRVEGATFTTSTARSKCQEKLERLAQEIISSEVFRHPSVGMTLK